MKELRKDYDQMLIYLFLTLKDLPGWFFLQFASVIYFLNPKRFR